MISGDPKKALVAPYSVVITETMAKKYFNRTDVAGLNLVVNDSTNYKITGVIKDIPVQSHFKFDFFLAMSQNEDSRTDNWLSDNYNTYILVKKGTSIPILLTKLDEMTDRHTASQLKAVVNETMEEFRKTGGFIRNSLTPLTDIHLHSNKTAELGANGSIQIVYIFSAIAIFILVIACVNFMNLSTARSSNRAKEVGVRKVLGSLRKNLVAQFLTETFLISTLSLLIALGTAWLMLPYFNILAGKDFHFSQFIRARMLLALVFLVPCVSLLAGSYPAFFLSAFQPIDVLKGRLAKGFKGSALRNVLVVFQFTISIILIVGTLVIYNQLHYIRTRDIGFRRDRVLIIQGTYALNDNAVPFKNALRQMSGVEDVTFSGYLPVEGYRSDDAFFVSPTPDVKSAMSMQRWTVDEHYINALGLQVIQGRNFSAQFPTDSGAIIINEAAVKFLGGHDVLHKRLYEIKDIKPVMTVTGFEIIGIVKNFNFSSLRDVVTPLALRLGKKQGAWQYVQRRQIFLPCCH